MTSDNLNRLTGMLPAAMPDFIPFLQAQMPIPAHALAALLAAPLGAAQLLLPPGGTRHRWSGRIWAGLMGYVALSGLFIHEIRLWGPFSPVHLLSLITLAGLARGVHAARIGNMVRHRRSMRLLFAALVIAGGFTVLPGRIMHQVIFGN